MLCNSISVVILAALLCPLSHASAQEILLCTFTGARGGAWPSGHHLKDMIVHHLDIVYIHGLTSKTQYQPFLTRRARGVQ